MKPKYGSEMAQESIPLKYVDSLSDKKHLVLLYDDEEYAQRIEFEFLKKGLMTGDSCIYATEMDPGLVILKMINSGIPVRYFLKKNLQVYQIPRLIDETEIMIKYARKLFKKILESASPPYRIVARIVADIGTPEGILAEMKLEGMHATARRNAISRLKEANRRIKMQKKLDRDQVAVVASASLNRRRK